jgi:hypothetical protein
VDLDVVVAEQQLVDDQRHERGDDGGDPQPARCRESPTEREGDDDAQAGARDERGIEQPPQLSAERGVSLAREDPVDRPPHPERPEDEERGPQRGARSAPHRALERRDDEVREGPEGDEQGRVPQGVQRARAQAHPARGDVERDDVDHGGEGRAIADGYGGPCVRAPRSGLGIVLASDLRSGVASPVSGVAGT